MHETLASSMSKISPILVSFMTDMETKVVLSDNCGLITLYDYYIVFCDSVIVLY